MNLECAWRDLRAGSIFALFIVTAGAVGLSAEPATAPLGEAFGRARAALAEEIPLPVTGPVRFDFGPEASPLLAALLAGSPELAPWVKVSGRPDRSLLCEVHVDRPPLESPPVVDGSNQMTCGSSVVLSLRRVPIEAWGNRFDRGGSVSFSGPLAVELTRVLEKEIARHSGDLMYYHDEAWDPGDPGMPARYLNGVALFGLSREPSRGSIATVLCNRQLIKETATGKISVRKTSCVLLDSPGR